MNISVDMYEDAIRQFLKDLKTDEDIHIIMVKFKHDLIDKGLLLDVLYEDSSPDISLAATEKSIELYKEAKSVNNISRTPYTPITIPTPSTPLPYTPIDPVIYCADKDTAVKRGGFMNPDFTCNGNNTGV